MHRTVNDIALKASLVIMKIWVTMNNIIIIKKLSKCMKCAV